VSWLPDIITLILGLIVGIGGTWKLAKGQGRREGERQAETKAEAARHRNYIETRERIDEADHKPLDGDDARDWLRDFSSGSGNGRPKR
jgi:hypothetical protein